MKNNIKLNLIYNRSSQNIIGINNDLLIKINDDLKWFRENTINKIIVMGYNTFKSLPGNCSSNPLKDRLNIIISKDHYDELRGYKGILVYSDFEEFYNDWFPNLYNNYKTYFEITPGSSRPSIVEHYRDVTEIFIIGGMKLYNHVLSNYKVDAIYETITYIDIDINESIKNGMNISYLDYIIPVNEYTVIYNKNKSSCGLLKTGKDTSKEVDVKYEHNIYQLSESINTIEMEYLRTLKYIYENGKARVSRNSEVISLFSPPSMRFDLTTGFPLLTSKKMPWKMILRELLWFISGSTDNKELQKNNIHIWDGNSSKEYLKTRGLNNYNNGELGPIYGFQWRHFGAEYTSCQDDYSGKGFDQLKYIIDEIKNNPGSRRIILNSWNPPDLESMALPPCHVMVQFYIDDIHIDARLTQRSGDMFLGIPFNIASYSMLLHIIGNITGYEPRYFIHDIGDAHIYKDHITSIEKQFKRKTYNPPKFVINGKIDSIDSITEDLFNMINYTSYPSITAKMVT